MNEEDKRTVYSAVEAERWKKSEREQEKDVFEDKSTLTMTLVAPHPQCFLSCEGVMC